MEARSLVDAIKAKARELGFDLVGIAPADPSQYADAFHHWLTTGQHGLMHYMARRVDERLNPGVYLPGAQSVICVAKNYHAPLEQAPDDGARGKVARYALGSDYHQLIKPRLYDLADWLRDTASCQTKCGVDTAPIMEREMAARSGIGWIGKNTCIIHPEVGSWLFLAEVLTTLRLPPDSPTTDHCGTCTRCIDACPTDAITPYHINATKCISYLTIEHAEEIDEGLQKQMGDWLFGCDICQDVCPFNRKAPTTEDEALQPRFADGTLPLNEVLRWQDDDYHRNFRRSAVRRIRLPMFQRNAEIAKDNASGSD